MNLVGALLRTPFFTLSYNDKLKVKQLGRPLPKLNIVYKQQSTKVDRWWKFNPEVYKKTNGYVAVTRKMRFSVFCVYFFAETVPGQRTVSVSYTHLIFHYLFITSSEICININYIIV